MAITEKLQILISADGRAAQQEFNKVGRTAELAIGKTDDKLKKLSGQMVSFGATTLAAGGVAAVGLYKLADAAGDLSESQNKANVVLGKEAAKSLEKYADGAATAAGISKRAATDAASTFAIFGKSAGLQGQGLADFSVELTQLAGDLASFSNTSPEEAITAIGAALRGESEPIRRYGVLLDDATLKAEALSQGIYDGTGTLTQQQRVLAAQAQILKQTTDAQGDFARTSDGLANQQRILAAEFENTKASIGEALLPAFQSLVGGLSDVASGFNGLPDGAKKAIGGVAGIGTAATVAVGGVSLLVGGGLRAVDAFKDLGSRLRGADGNLTTMGRTATTVGGILGAAGLAFAAYQVADALNEATKNTVGFDTALKDLKSASSGIDLDKAIADGAGATAGKVDDLSDAFYRLTTAGKNVGKVDIGDYSVQIDDLTRYLDRLYKEDPQQLERVLDRLGNIEDLRPKGLGVEATAEFDNLANRVKDYQENIDAASKSSKTGFENFRGGIDRWRVSVDAAGDTADDFSTSLDQMTKLTKLSSDMFDLAGDRADNFMSRVGDTSMLDNLITSQLDLRQASTELADGLSALQGVSIGTFALGATQVSDEAAAALGDVAGAASAAQQQIADMLQFYGADAAVQKADSLRTGFTDMFEAAGLTERQVTDLLDSMGLLPEQIDTAITLSGTDEAIAKLNLLRDYYTNADGTSGIPAEVETQVSLAIAEGRFVDAANLISIWVQDQEDGSIENPLLIALGLGDTKPASDDVDSWKSDEEGKPPAQLPIGVDDTVARKGAAALFFDIGRLNPKMTVDVLPRYDNGLIRLLNGYTPPTGFVPFGGVKGGGSDGNPATPYATGGYVTGKGTGTSDDIPARLSNGEFVMKAAAVDKIGVPTLNAMNAGMQPTSSLGNDKGQAALLDALRQLAANMPDSGDQIVVHGAVDPIATAEEIVRTKRANKYLAGRS